MVLSTMMMMTVVMMKVMGVRCVTQFCGERSSDPFRAAGQLRSIQSALRRALLATVALAYASAETRRRRRH